MKKELTAILIDMNIEELSPREQGYYRRMVTTLQAVGITVAATNQAACNIDGSLALTDTDAAKDAFLAAGLPVVYYSPACKGGYGAHMLLLSLQEIGYDFFEQIFDRFHGQPWTVMETERCILREAVIEDLDAFYELYGETDAVRFMEPLPADRQEGRQQLAAYIANQYPFYGFGTWTVIHRETGEMIGRAGLHLAESAVELGYIIRETYRNQGYATEVCRAILRYAKKELELSKLTLKIHSDNAPSLKLAKKLGFCPCDRDTSYCKVMEKIL